MLLAAAAAVLALAAPADASLMSCERGAASFEAAMESVPGTAKMGMKFTLQARTKRRFRRVDAPGFNEWTVADPGVSRYVYTRRVEELLGGARYRVTVRFRWQDAAGNLIGRAKRRSRACRQADLRPNLEIAELSVEDGRYVAVVRNSGRGPAEAFAVRIGTAEVWLDGLGARRERRIEVEAPPCEPGTEVGAEADPENRVDERSERDNARSVVCW